MPDDLRIVAVEHPDADPATAAFNRADPHCERCDGLGTYPAIALDGDVDRIAGTLVQRPCPCTERGDHG